MGSGRDAAGELVKRYHARFRPIHTFCSDESIWRDRVEKRIQNALPNETPATWEGILSERNNYRLWQPEDALFVDACRSIDENLDKVLQYIQS